MKLKTKLGALTLGLVLMLGTLVGCAGNNKKVNVHADPGCSVVGLNEKGYKEGDKVSFTVNVTDVDKEIQTVELTSAELSENDGIYSFTMPGEDVDLTVTLKEKIKYSLNISPSTVKVGITSTYALNFGDRPVVNYSLEATSGAEHVEIDNEFFEIKGLSVGEVTLAAKIGTEVVLTKSITVVEPEHGEKRSDPLDSAEAYKIAKSLEKGEVTEIPYYIKGVVTEVVENDDKFPNVTLMLDDFEIFQVPFDTLDRTKFVKGAVILVYAKITNFNGTYETDKNFGEQKVLSVDNSKLALIDVGNISRHVQLEGEATIKAGLYPEAKAGDHTIEWTVEDKTIADVSVTSGFELKVSGKKLGSTKIVATCPGVEDLKTEITIDTVDYEVHGESEDDPATGQDIVNATKGLESGEITATQYYIKDLIYKVDENDKERPNFTVVLSGGFEAFRIPLAKDDPLRDSVVKGAELFIKSKVTLFYSTLETAEKMSTFISLDASKVRLIELEYSVESILLPGQSFQISGKAFPTDEEHEDGLDLVNPVFTSSDSTVATVDEDGLVTAVGGEELQKVTITVSCFDGSAKVEFAVTPNGKTLQPSKEAEFVAGATFYMALADKDNSSVLRYLNGEMDNYYGKTVTQFAEAALITLEASGDANYPFRMKVGNDQYLEYERANGHDNITFGKEVSAKTALLKYGEYTAADSKTHKGWIAKMASGTDVMVLGNSKASSGNETNTIRFNKQDLIHREVNLYSFQTALPITGVALPATSEVTVGKKTTLTVEVTPTEGTLYDPNKTTWTSSDKTVATVANGVVTALKVGTTTITASYEGVATPATCTLTVKPYEAFSSTTDFKKLTTTAAGTSKEITDMNKIKTILDNADITEITGSKVYAADTGQGPGIVGLKVGTTSDGGGGEISFTFNKKFSKITLEVRGWNSSKLAKVTVNGVSYTLTSANAGETGTNYTMIVNLDVETDTVTIATNLAAVFQSMKVETVE